MDITRLNTIKIATDHGEPHPRSISRPPLKPAPAAAAETPRATPAGPGMQAAPEGPIRDAAVATETARWLQDKLPARGQEALSFSLNHPQQALALLRED